MIDILMYITLAIITAACAWTSYGLGRKDGAGAMIDILHEQKIISYDETGNIVPNPFYLPEE